MAKIQKDADRYQDICNKRKEAAKISHIQRSSKCMQMHANAANTSTNFNTKSIQHEDQYKYQYDQQNQSKINGNNQIQNTSMQMHEEPFSEQEHDDLPF